MVSGKSEHGAQIQTIAAGSKNPAKLCAVSNAVHKVWPNARIDAVDAPSGVRDQPLDDDEAIQGAVNRALFSRLALDADLGFGLEGSVVDTAYGMFLCGWVAVVDRSFEPNVSSAPNELIQSAVLSNAGVSLACTSRILLPTAVADQIRAGRELGPLMDQLTQRTDTKHALGANGILTNGLIQRADSFEQGVIFALARYITPHYYD